MYSSREDRSVCSTCHEPAQAPARLLRCEICKTAKYCTRECQKTDWRAGHKQLCSKLKLEDGIAPGAEGLFTKAKKKWIHRVLNSEEWCDITMALLKTAEAAEEQCVICEARWEPSAKFSITVTDVTTANFRSNGIIDYPERKFIVREEALKCRRDKTVGDVLGVVVVFFISYRPVVGQCFVSKADTNGVCSSLVGVCMMKEKQSASREDEDTNGDANERLKLECVPFPIWRAAACIYLNNSFGIGI